MEEDSTPRPYQDWRKDEPSRTEDAAHTFGYHLMKHCRDEAIKGLPSNMGSEDREKAIEAVHLALHNAMRMLEGFWRLGSGPDHTVNYQLSVSVKDQGGNTIEDIDITAGIDLPIGFWSWAREADFR